MSKDLTNFDNGVPFDPGYSPLSFSFIENIAYITRDYNQLKASHQKKFKLVQLEPAIMEMINKSTAFYLGCMLWGGFLSSRFKGEDGPKEILGNHTLKLSPEDQKTLDCAEETKFTLQYLEFFERDYKYYVNKPAKIPAMIKEILTNYNEFAEINNNFIQTKKTSDIKLPKSMSHFSNLTNVQLDELKSKIVAVIDSGKVENLLEISFYNI